MGKEFKSKCPLDNNEVEDVAAAAAEVAVEAAEVVAKIADPSVVVVVAVTEEAAPEAAAGNVVLALDGLPLIDQCLKVAVGQPPHLEDEGLAQPLVRIKADAEVNLNTLVFFLLACQVHFPCSSCSRSFHHYFVLHTLPCLDSTV